MLYWKHIYYTFTLTWWAIIKSWSTGSNEALEGGHSWLGSLLNNLIRGLLSRWKHVVYLLWLCTQIQSNVLSAMKEHPILTRSGFQVLETQDTGSDSMSTDAQRSQNHSGTGGGEIILFFNMRYCTQASTDPRSVSLFPRKTDLERGFKDSRTQILAWTFSHHISSKFARSEDFSLELHLNPGHFSLSEERGVYLYLCF